MFGVFLRVDFALFYFGFLELQAAQLAVFLDEARRNPTRLKVE